MNCETAMPQLPNLPSMTVRLLLAFVIYLGVLGSALAFAGEARVALVIGNGAYRNVPALPNPPHDAVDVAAALKRSGFDVVLAGRRLDAPAMEANDDQPFISDIRPEGIRPETARPCARDRKSLPGV